MKGLYKVVYCILSDYNLFNDFFYAHDIDEMKTSLKELFEEYEVNNDSIYINDCVITATGGEYNLSITIEAVSLIDDAGLEAIINP
jgi:hypothetical protein